MDTGWRHNWFYYFHLCFQSQSLLLAELLTQELAKTVQEPLPSLVLVATSDGAGSVPSAPFCPYIYIYSLENARK